MTNTCLLMLFSKKIIPRVGISHMSVKNIKDKLETGQPTSSRIGHCGRKRSTTTANDRYLLRSVKKMVRPTASELKREWESTGVAVSVSTVKRRLSELGCKNRAVRKVPLLTQAMKRKRLEFARKYANWTVDDWKKVNKQFFIFFFT